MKMSKFMVAASMAAVLAAPALAAVIFDPSTGTGFVGKGDVQLAFGWNNKQLQDNADGVVFTYSATTTTGYDCEFYTGPTQNRTRHEVSHNKTQSISSSVSKLLRANSKGKDGEVTGFILSGFGATPVITGGAVPAIGDACPGNPGQGAVVIAVDAESTTTGGLYANGVLLQ
jgi:opacity protein-like surface antigen